MRESNRRPQQDGPNLLLQRWDGSVVHQPSATCRANGPSSAAAEQQCIYSMQQHTELRHKEQPLLQQQSSCCEQQSNAAAAAASRSNHSSSSILTNPHSQHGLQTLGCMRGSMRSLQQLHSGAGLCWTLLLCLLLLLGPQAAAGQQLTLTVNPPTAKTATISYNWALAASVIPQAVSMPFSEPRTVSLGSHEICCFCCCCCGRYCCC